MNHQLYKITLTELTYDSLEQESVRTVDTVLIMSYYCELKREDLLKVINPHNLIKDLIRFTSLDTFITSGQQSNITEFDNNKYFKFNIERLSYVDLTHN